MLLFALNAEQKANDRQIKTHDKTHRNGDNNQHDTMAFCKDGDLPHVKQPTYEDPLVHSMETCLVSYHFASSPCFKHQDVFIFKAFREGEPELRHNDQWCSPIVESIVDAWRSLNEVYAHLWEQEEQTKTGE